MGQNGCRSRRERYVVPVHPLELIVNGMPKKFQMRFQPPRPRWQKSECFCRRVILCCLWAMLALSVASSSATDLPVRKVIHQYALTSANDFPQRDPEDWRLLGSNDGGRTWVTLDVRTNEQFSARQQRKLYQIANDTAFGMYRLEIDRVLDPGVAGSVQLAEMELMGRDKNDRSPTPGFADPISAEGDNPPAETAANLFDGHVETKWLDWAPNERTRASWVQWQYANPAKTRIRKTIHQYALTSANDFPQRDPQDWRLLGFDDGSQTWVTLDVRTNQLFSARQQRKLYQITNETAFGAYRFEIDRVRDPGAVSSVQLAEIELMGQNEDDRDPTPTFTDELSAAGDNPPAETVVKLFDGRVETKWLDWAPDESTRASWIQWQYVDPANIIVTNLSQLLALQSQAHNGIRVRLKAVVAGQLSPGDKICLVDATGCIVLNQTGHETSEDGQTVLIDGVIQWVGGQMGIKEGSRQFLVLAAPAAPERISLEQPLSQSDNLKWVEIEGQIQYPHLTGTEISFDVQDGLSSMRVYFPYQDNLMSLPPPGTKVRIRGVCVAGFNESGRWVATQLWAAGPAALNIVDTNIRDKSQTVSQTATLARRNPATLMTIGQIRQMTPEELKTNPRVKIRGVVTDELEGFVQDDTAGIEVVFSPESKRKITAFGDYIAIDGSAGLDDLGGLEIRADQVVVLGKGKPPPPETLTPGQLASGQTDARWIAVDGVVYSTDGSHLLLTCYGQQLMATITEAPVQLVDNLVDAEVRVCGVEVTARDNQGRVQGIHLLIPSLDYVDVVTPSAVLGTLPVRNLGSLLGLSGPGGPTHRVKVQGVVTLQQNQKIFLQDDSGNAMAILKENVVLDSRFGRKHWLYWQTTPTEIGSNSVPSFQPGDRIQVVGFPETHRYSPVITEAIVTRLGVSQSLKPATLTVDGLAEGGQDSSLVTFDGMLRGQTTIGVNLLLDMEWQDRTLQVLVPRQVDDSFKPELGSRLRVTGICQIDPPAYPELGLVSGPVRILTRSSEDLIVLARPPWLTGRRALTLVGGMSFIVLAGLFWIRELRRQVDERTTQLSTQIHLRERAESRHALEQERARIAKDLHDDLGANLTQIIFLSERVEGAQPGAPEATRWFNLIPATARRTIQSLDEIVWAINPQNDSLESLANYLSQFAQQHLALAHARCILDVPTVLPAVPLSTEVRHNLLLATREALQNAVTHASASEVRLSLKLNDDGLNIMIADNGRGFDPGSVPESGNGLKNMRQRMGGLGGRLELHSQAGQGTTVSLWLPAIKLHSRVMD
jgi:signal transduction histidine kinase